jgi:flagellar hook-basal body protein
LQYVNQYGQIKSYNEVKDELTTAKTQLISLDELTDKRTSAPAAITGQASTVDLTGGTNTFAMLASLPTPIDLSSLFRVNVDGSTEPVTVDLSYLKNSSTILTGSTLAAEATKYLNRKFGDETTFNFTSTAAGTNPDEAFSITNSRVQNGAPITVPISLSGYADKSNVSTSELTSIIQTQIDNSVLGGMARESVTISGTATGAVTFLGRAVKDSASGDLPSATATKIVADWNTTEGKAAFIAANQGLANIELGYDKTFVVLTYHQFPKQTVAIAGTATSASVFMGVTVAAAPATGVTGNSAAQTCSAIVAKKADVLAGAAAKAAGLTDIQIDPSNSSQLVLVYDQTAATRASITPTLTGGNTAAASVVLNNINAGLVTSSGIRPTPVTAATSAGASFTAGSVLSAGLAKSPMTVTYDFNTQSFKFTDNTNAGANVITLSGGTVNTTVGGVTTTTVKPNAILGLGTSAVTLDANGLSNVKMLPNNKNPIRSITDQRYGIKVNFDAVSKSFAVSSGTTGDGSAISIDQVSASGLSLLGLPTAGSAVTKSSTALRGIKSSPAIAVGKTPTVNVANNFAVDSTNNKFVITVDGIKGDVVIPTSATYSLASFTRELEKGINALASADGDSPTTVNGVKVSYDYTQNVFKFTSGTTGSDSFIKVSGSNAWGLDQVEAGRGTTSTWIKPSQHKDIVGGAVAAKYIDKDGKETTNGDGFTTLPAWSPIFLDKGELTFNTAGKLYSPLKGTQLETVYLAGGKGALTINVDYAASTQFTSPFAVLSQSQDGAPEGSLVGVTIGNDGLVSASFSNGTQKSLAKILLTNFSNPAGLRQMGDSSFLASASSGKPILGAAGSAGFGTLRAGATERANVDLTQELVDLITAQRNFQANAKAIETSSTMTSAIINLRA